MEIVNCDLGVVTYAANLVTVTDVLIRVSQSRISRVNLYQGHIALGTGIFTTDVLFTNFNVSGSWIHDLTAYGASHVAFLNGTGTNLNMDGHRGAPFATLFHNVYVGLGSRAMTSGGLAAEGFPFASETTFWNIRAKGGKDLTLKTNTLYGYCTFGTYMNFVQDENLATVWKGTPCKDYFMEQGTSARSLSAWLPQLMPRSP